MAYLILFILVLFSLHIPLSRTEFLDACPEYLDLSTIRRVIESAIIGPEGNPDAEFIPSTIYINCYGNAREPGKYSTLSATLDFELAAAGKIQYTREDFKCVNKQWQPVGLATQFFDPDETPTQTRNASFSRRGCAVCDSTGSSDEFGCVECTEECNQTVQGYPKCFAVGTDGCCHHLVNNKCVSRCPSNYVVSSLNTSLCECADHWTGDNCLTCPLSCLNNGTVEEGCAGCACALGYTGGRCESEIDYCAPPPCLNNGTCSYDLSGYTCSCAPGYTDLNCSKEIDFCYPYPCLNEGICENSRLGFFCQCLPGTSGEFCESVDYCHSNPCANNGECTNTGVSAPAYLCSCPNGYLGRDCEIIDHCYNAMCQNSAPCINSADGYECNCTRAFFGQQCEYEVTACRPNPCLNYGICLEDSTPDGFTCTCQKAFTGEICEEEIDHCENVTCLNNGTCSNEFFGFLCNCIQGFEGRFCEEQIDYCETEPCQNGGVCSYDRFGYNCTCPIGYHDANCSQLVQYCSPNPCENNGTCSNSPSGYNCSCAVGYRGETCQIEIDYCNPPPCDKGVCQGSTGGYTCVCDLGYTGVNCSIPIDSCSEGVCLNGGICIQLVGNFTCECQAPYSGRQCERIDPDKVCPNISCQNGGRCNHTSLREADQSDLRKVLEGRSDVGSTSPCECEGRWEGSYCDHCPICEKPNVDCQECECKGLWSGPDCSDCSGHTTSEGECSETADTPSDTTNIIPIVIPLLLAGLGGLGSIPCIACISCKCKKMCKKNRRPKIHVHVIHKDLEKNGSTQANKKGKTKARDELSDKLQRLTGALEESPTHSIVSTFSASEKSKHSTELPETLASGIYDRLTPAAEGHRGAVRFMSQSSGGFKSRLRSPLASVPDESELRLISSSDNSQTQEVHGYSNHSESSFTDRKV